MAKPRHYPILLAPQVHLFSEYCLDSSTTLAPFKLESVPGSLDDCRQASELCGDEGRRYLKWGERMLKTPEEMEDNPPEEITNYTDPVFNS